MLLRTSDPSQVQQRGSALVVSVVLLAVISTFTVSYLSISTSATRRTELELDEHAVASGAESVTALAVNRLWGRFQAERAGRVTTRADFRAWLDGLGIPNQKGAVPQVTADMLPLLALPTGADGADELADVHVESLEVLRTDETDGTRLVFTTTVTSRRFDPDSQDWRNLRHSVQQAYAIEPEDWQGLDFALLANNINCIMCHAEIDSAERAFNRDEGLWNTFDRVKVGSIESLQLRRFPESWIAGTLYLGGRAYTASGTPITAWHSQDIKSRAFDGEGKLLQDGWGDTRESDFDPADPNNPAELENLYLDYGQDPDKMVDGFFPDAFPPVFADDAGEGPDSTSPEAGNRLVDDSEFYATASTAEGTISGGAVSVVTGADPIDTRSELDDLLNRPNATSLGGMTEGNVVLVGTEDDPIVIDGQVAIHGDLVIHGSIQGEGSLLVSGNVYVPSDLTYADGSDPLSGKRNFGRNTDGSENALAIASGGNIVVGNMFHPRWGNGTVTGDPQGSFSFILDELAIFNRQEWTKTQQILPGLNEDPLDPTTWTAVNPLYEGPAYVPRYYVFNEGGTIPIHNRGMYFDPVGATWVGREHPGRWSRRFNTWADVNDPADPVLYNADGSPKAVVYRLSAKNGWLSDLMLRTLMTDVIGSRDQRTPLEIDSLLYSNNSIFGIIPTRTRGQGFDGHMVVNGGIVAADIGLLAPNRIQINYDPRPKDLLDLASETQIGIRRLVRAPAAP